MDSTCKKAFLIVIGIPVILVLLTAWIFAGGETISGNWFDGIFEGLSMMWPPTILFIIGGWLVDKFIFDSTLLKCMKRKSSIRKKII